MIAAVTDPAVLDGYLVDASNVRGFADRLYRPRDAEEVAAILANAQSTGMPVTVTARRTSTTGAPVPTAGALVSTEGLARILGRDVVESGVLLGAYQAMTEREGWLFPPDPTSREECSVGGAVACNASGARSFRFGPTRPWIEAVDLVTPTGEVLREVTRATPSPWPVPRWTEPRTKTAAGSYPADNLLDLVIGAEGTLGVVTRVRTRLIPLPAHVLGLLAYFPNRASTLGFVAACRAMPPQGGPRCVEYFDRHSLDLIRGRAPDVPDADSAIFLEIEHADPEPPVEDWVDRLLQHDALIDDTVVATDAPSRARLHELRHALPAGVNERLSRTGVPKVGTDFAVPADALPEMMDLYDQHDIPTVCFGHIGDAHLHLNFLPRDAAELAEARRRYTWLAERAIALGGTVSAEHGIGRHKRALLAKMVPPALIDAWRALRAAADPAGVLGRGVMV